MRVASQLSILTTRHTISSTFSNCNSKHVSNSTRTCSKPRAWHKCRTSQMRITYLPSKSNSLTRCQVRERLVSTDKSMKTECPLSMMPELMPMSLLIMRTILSTDSRIPYNKYILYTHNLIISSSSKCKEGLRMIWLKSKGDLKRYSITIPPLEIG